MQSDLLLPLPRGDGSFRTSGAMLAPSSTSTSSANIGRDSVKPQPRPLLFYHVLPNMSEPPPFCPQSVPSQGLCCLNESLGAMLLWAARPWPQLRYSQSTPSSQALQVLPSSHHLKPSLHMTPHVSALPLLCITEVLELFRMAVATDVPGPRLTACRCLQHLAACPQSCPPANALRSCLDGLLEPVAVVLECLREHHASLML